MPNQHKHNYYCKADHKNKARLLIFELTKLAYSRMTVVSGPTLVGPM